MTTQPQRDTLHRTVKLFMDDGTSPTIEAAHARARSLRLQIAVGPSVATCPSRAAALTTAVNAASRALLGGVAVHGHPDLAIPTPWGTQSLRTLAERYGARVVDRLDADSPTLSLWAGETSGSVTIHLLADGWIGGVTTNPSPPTHASPLATMFAAAVAVSEAFQHTAGSQLAGRRSLTVSLWRPHLHPTNPAAQGPELSHLPDTWWLIGLGHLGQAHAWTIAHLPYQHCDHVDIWLQDHDLVVPANTATSLLTSRSDVNQRKVRVVATKLEAAGFHTTSLERRLNSRSGPQGQEPPWALAGLDHPSPRRHLGQFHLAIDAGIGNRPDTYLDILIHCFPGPVDPADAFPAAERPTSTPAAPAYQHLEGAMDPCGVVDLAGAAVGAAFVGAAAAPLGVAEVLRALAGDTRYSAIGFSLRDGALDAAPQTEPHNPTSTPGILAARNEPLTSHPRCAVAPITNTPRLPLQPF